MGARRGWKPRGNVSFVQHEVFCCDSDSLINLRDADLLRKLRSLVKNGKVKVPGGVYRELQRKTDKLAKTLQTWKKKYSLVVELNHRCLELLPDIEEKYGGPFGIGGKTYGGFWASSSGRRSADAQIVALAKARGWIAISNDNSIHGACMLEDVVCRRWEEMGRLLLGAEQPTLPGFELGSN